MKTNHMTTGSDTTLQMLCLQSIPLTMVNVEHGCAITIYICTNTASAIIKCM